MGGSRPDEDGQNSSWRPPGKPENLLRRRRDRKAPVGLPWLLMLATCSSTLADSMQEGSPELETPPAHLDTDVESLRQGRDLVEQQVKVRGELVEPTLAGWTPSAGVQVPIVAPASRDLRPLIKKASSSLPAVRWARSTTVRPRLPRQSALLGQVAAKPIPEHFIQPAFLLPFGQRLAKESTAAQARKASTQDVIKPSNIRKRNFSASLVQSVSQEERWEGIPDQSNNIGVPDQKNLETSSLEERKTAVNEEIKGERARGAIARDVSVIVPKKAESDWERSRISVRRDRPSHETSSGGGRGGLGGGASLGPRGGGGLSRGQPKPAGESKQEQPRRRIRLNRSKLGIYQMVQSTTRSPRQDDDAPQRPSKRDRIRNLKIRRPVNSNVNSTQPAASSPASQHPSLAAKSGIGGQLRVSSSTSRVPTSSSTRGTTTTERMLSGRLEYQDIVRTTKAQQYQDNVEYQDIVRTTKARQYPDEVEYQDIVRTTPMQESTRPSTVVVRTKPTTTTTKPITTSSERSQPIHLVSTTELFRGTEPSTSTLRSSTKEAETTQVTKSTSYQIPSSSSPDLTKSTLAMPESSTTESSESQTSTISQSVLATPSVTPIDGSDGSDEVKQSSEDGVRISNEDQTQSEITTRNPVELPSRPREELKQDLLEAIRRKISRNKVSTSSSSSGVGQKSETGFEISSQSSDLNRTPSSVLPKSSSLRAVRLATSSFSPAFNSVSSTRPPFFRPISFPPRSSAGKLDIPKVRIFVNIPEEKPGGGVKIPHVSHIQDKLKRLNAAITAGLKHDQEEKEREEAIRADWQGEDDYEDNEEEEERIEEVEALFHEAMLEGSVEGEAESSGSRLEAGGGEGELRALSSIAHNVTVLPERQTTVRTTTVPTTTERLTTTTTTKVPSSTTTTRPPTSPMTRRPPTKKPREWRKKKPTLLFEHPSSHFRPSNSSGDLNDFIPMPKSNLPAKEDVFIVTPKYGMYTPVADAGEGEGRVAANETMRKPNDAAETTGTLGAENQVIEDITGTTVYVIGIIAVIPAIGLLAWFIRLAVRRKGLGGSESSSETGLNRPITEEDALQITGRAGFSLPSHSFDTIQEAPENIPKAEPTDMLGSLWEFPRARLRLQTVLGEGNFGKVWKAEVDDICGYEGTILVAVKGVKENAAQREKDDLVEEMKIMQEIGPHPNVVTILGVCTQQEPYLLIMEYVMYGKLLTHLREQRMRQSSFFNFSKDGGEAGETLTSKDLNKFAYGVAKGMEFLVSKGVIHRDLAARNILVDHNKNTKISDFGLSRNLRDLGGEMYEQKTKGALPIRWMAPESLYFSVFTPKSDVWGFGILMWEIVTLGSTPYPGMGAREVMRRVRDGYRLERPAHCHPDLYLIIQKCWAGDMNKRPDFSELRKEIAKLLEDQHGYIDLQNIPENKYYSMDQNPDEEEKL